MKTPRVGRGPPPSSSLLLLLLAAVCIEAYRPVIIVHGLLDGPKEFEELKNFITKAHPGTEVDVISLYNYRWSLEPLWRQVEGFKKAIAPIMERASDGVHLLCFSQGGVVCRGLLSIYDNHNVHSFIALSSPLAGQYGDTDYLRWLFPNFMKKTLYRICYTRVGQWISICDYWNDPHQRIRYLRDNTYLPLLDGDKAHKNLKSWRENFLRIKNLVLIGGPDDGVITPWQSSHFGFYDSNENIVEMRDQKFYKQDTFGLKTLDARGNVTVYVQAGVKHTSWHSNHTVFQNYMEKWLT